MTSYNTSLECCTKKPRIDYSQYNSQCWTEGIFLLKTVSHRWWEKWKDVHEKQQTVRASRLLTKASNTFLWHERTWRNIMLSVACSCLQVNKAGYHRRTSHQSAAGWMRQQLRHQVIKDWGGGDEGLIFLDAELTVCTQLERNHATLQHQAVALTPFSEERCVCVWTSRSSKSGYLTGTWT